MHGLRDTRAKLRAQSEIPRMRGRCLADCDLSVDFSNADRYCLTIRQHPVSMSGICAVCPDVRIPADFRDGPASAFHAGYCVRRTARQSYLAPTSEQTTY